MVLPRKRGGQSEAHITLQHVGVLLLVLAYVIWRLILNLQEKQDPGSLFHPTKLHRK